MRVLVTRRLPEGGLEPLAGHELVGPKPDEAPYSPDEFPRTPREVDAIVCLLTDRIDADVLGARPGPARVVANVAVGYDNVDVGAAPARAWSVCNTPDVLDETTADPRSSLILAAARLVSQAERDLRDGTWKGWGITQYMGRDVYGATLGIVGFGRIGQAVATPRHRVRHERDPPLTHALWPSGLRGRSRRDCWHDADIVSLHIPGGPATHHLVDARRLALDEAHRGARQHRARHGRRRSRARRRAPRRSTCSRPGSTCTSGSPRSIPRLLGGAPHRAAPAHRLRRRTRRAPAWRRMATSAVATVLAGGTPPNVV